MVAEYEGLLNVRRLLQQDYKCKAHNSVLELNVLHKRVTECLIQSLELEKTLGEASNRLKLKGNEINALRDEVAQLKKALDEARSRIKPQLNYDDSEEWMQRFNELQIRHRRDVENYENELCRKDQIILELRDRINTLLATPPQVVHTVQSVQPAMHSVSSRGRFASDARRKRRHDREAESDHRRSRNRDRVA